ncbi:DNA repair protein [Vibrio sp. RC27]
MSIGLIITLVGILLVMVLGYNVMLQYKAKVNAAKKQESTRQFAIIDSTEQLISNAHHIPYSRNLLICLNTRILDSLENILECSPENKQIKQRIVDVKNHIKAMKAQGDDTKTAAFRVPSSDKQAVGMLKLVKRLRETIRSEHNKGRFETQAFIAENARLETIQLRINIENLMKRSNDAIAKGQVGTAVQLLKKGIDVLSQKNDEFSVQAREKLQTMFDDMENSRKSKLDEGHEQVDDERKNDMAMLFGEKKKW